MTLVRNRDLLKTYCRVRRNSIPTGGGSGRGVTYVTVSGTG